MSRRLIFMPTGCVGRKICIFDVGERKFTEYECPGHSLVSKGRVFLLDDENVVSEWFPDENKTTVLYKAPVEWTKSSVAFFDNYFFVHKKEPEKETVTFHEPDSGKVMSTFDVTEEILDFEINGGTFYAATKHKVMGFDVDDGELFVEHTFNDGREYYDIDTVSKTLYLKGPDGYVAAIDMNAQPLIYKRPWDPRCCGDFFCAPSTAIQWFEDKLVLTDIDTGVRSDYPIPPGFDEMII